MNHEVQIKAIEGSDEFMVVLPEQVLSKLDWRVGDSIKVDASLGRIALTNRSKDERKNPDDESAKKG